MARRSTLKPRKRPTTKSVKKGTPVRKVAKRGIRPTTRKRTR